MQSKETFEFKLGGKPVDFRSDTHHSSWVHAVAPARQTSEFLRVKVSALTKDQAMGIRVFLAWLRGDVYY